MPFETTLRLRYPTFSFPGEQMFVECMKDGNENHVKIGSAFHRNIFDHVYSSHCGQVEVFFTSVVANLEKFIAGCDIHVIAIGGPASGKSYTLWGPGVAVTQSEAEYGIIQRVATFLFSNLNELSRLSMSIYEVSTTGQVVRDLLSFNNDEYLSHLVENERGLITVVNVLERGVATSAELIFLVDTALSRRTKCREGKDTSTVMVKLILNQMHPHGEGFIRSQAVFVDLVSGLITLPPQFSSPMAPAVVPSDLFVLDNLVNMAPFIFQEELLGHNFLFLLLKEAFLAQTHTSIICCISPKIFDHQISSQYLRLMFSFVPLRAINLREEVVCDRISNYSPSDFGENLSVSEEEDSFNNRNQRQEVEDDPCNQHGLERIEEESEEFLEDSEEDILSSNGKMSESHIISSDHSFCDSDQDDGDRASQYSENEFRNNLKNYCSQFTYFVDNTVDSFKTATTDFMPKEKGNVRLSPTARRGGVQHMGNDITTGCNDSSLDQPQPSGAPVVSPNVSQQGDPLVNDDDRNGRNASNDIVPFRKKLEEWLIAQENHLSMLRKAWQVTMNQSPQQRVEIEDNMSAITRVQDDFERVTELVQDLLFNTNTGEKNRVHKVREYRKLKSKFTTMKSELDSKVKNNIANEEEERDFIIFEEMIEILDTNIEYTNSFQQGSSTVDQISLPDTEAGQLATETLKCLSIVEIKNLFHWSVKRLVDLRETEKNNETYAATQEQLIKMNELRIKVLQETIHKLREEGSSQMVMQYPTTVAADETYSDSPSHTTVAATATATATTIAVPQPSTSGGGQPTSIPSQRLKQLSGKPTPPVAVYVKRKNNRYTLNQFCKKP